MKTPSARIVVKLGTGVLTSGVGQLDETRMANVAAQIQQLRASGAAVVIVSSAAVGLGMGRLGLTRRPQAMAKKQACAAIGQRLLMDAWQRAFAPHEVTVAQVLLTHDDLRLRRRHLAVADTIEQLLEYGVVPVINENDTVSAEEIRFGDNDVLSAMVASLTRANCLFILSTAPGLIDKKGTGEVVPVVESITPEIEAMADGTSSETAVGGMVSKITAAGIAVKARCGVFIASGAEPDILRRLLDGTGPGTFFVPAGIPMAARKRWLAFFQRPTGTVHINERALPALREQGGSLLAVGVTKATGQFAAGDIIDIAGPGGAAIARGVTRFDQADVTRIAGLSSAEIKPLFPNRKRLEVVHRNDLVLIPQ